ncbi:MAG: ABC transporter ATP-binding protein [Lachnospiraceae bacterium]|nr:ABC transporter ATP-binding protein [Lachnospiraceae bacterium]
MSEIVIKVRNLSKVYHSQTALDDCNLQVEDGDIYSLVCENGAGKTTLFKILLGFVEATFGVACVLGTPCSIGNPEILRRTGNVIETPAFYEHLSAAENLTLHLDYMHASGQTPSCSTSPAEALDIVGLRNLSSRPIRELSLGMRQRTAIARALLHQPRLLILDEPTNGLDPIGIADMRDLFLQLKSGGTTIILSSHHLSEVARISDRIGIMACGHIVKETTPYEIEQNSQGSLETYYIRSIKEGAYEKTT